MAGKQELSKTQVGGGWEADPYFKTRLELTFGAGKSFLFDTASLLFSPFQIDVGTDLLLREVGKARIATKAAHMLEIGCNYGALGLPLAGLYPKSEVWLCDKDLLAVRYTRHNAALNKLENVKIWPAIGLNDLPPQDFDLIFCNLPTKIGDRAIEFDFILAPLQRLKPEGAYYIVAPVQINRLLPVVARRHKLALQEITRQNGQIIYRLTNKAK